MSNLGLELGYPDPQISAYTVSFHSSSPIHFGCSYNMSENSSQTFKGKGLDEAAEFINNPSELCQGLEGTSSP